MKMKKKNRMFKKSYCIHKCSCLSLLVFGTLSLNAVSYVSDPIFFFIL